MTKSHSTKAVTGLFCILFLASCGRKTIDLSCTQISDLTGKAVIAFPNHEIKDAFTGMMIPVGSKITVGPSSKIVIGVNGVKSFAASENTILCINSIADSTMRTSLAAQLFDGRLLCVVPVALKIEPMSTPVTIRSFDKNASFLVRCNKESRVLVVKTLGAAASMSLAAGQTISVPSCCKVLINSEGSASRPLPLNEKDFADIEPILGKPAADSLINAVACPQTMRLESNEPPQWIQSPTTECTVGKPFSDTLRAKDPEGSFIRYRLLHGPVSMSLDSVTGILKFMPKKPGVYPVEVAAVDSTNTTANMTYELSAIAESKKASPYKLHAVISAPAAAAPGEAVTIDASRGAAASIPPQSLMYRFDINGEVIGANASGNGFVKQSAITYTFKTEGAYTIHVKVKDSKGLTAQAHGAITIRAKPIAVITVSPPEIFAATECMLDAGRSVVGKSASPLRVRWDLDNNGTWDFPGSGEYTEEKKVKKTWTKPGIYSVVLEIQDKFGSQAWASAEIEVKAPRAAVSAVKPDTVPAKKMPNTESNALKIVKPPISVIVKAGGIYQTQVCAPLTLEGSAHATGGAIRSFSWDFEGDGTFDTTLSATGKSVHTYRKAGAFKAILKVVTGDTTDKKAWFDTATVMVLNAPPVAHAGKDVFSKKGRTVSLKGAGEDSDDGIALYEWDFNNDGIFDWSSQKNGKVEHRFDSYASAVLRVTDNNGLAAKDTVRIVICPEGMVEVEQGLFCIDEYEWPNKKGQTPDRDMPYADALKKCSDAGKRLCSNKEWESACAGKHNRQFPKSNAPATQNCNVIGNHAFPNKVAPSGSFSDCESPAGAYDMNGNVAEWTASEKPDSAYVYGGSWHNDLANATCSSKLLLKKATGYFYVGFRCCK